MALNIKKHPVIIILKIWKKNVFIFEGCGTSNPLIDENYWMLLTEIALEFDWTLEVEIIVSFLIDVHLVVINWGIAIFNDYSGFSTFFRQSSISAILQPTCSPIPFKKLSINEFITPIFCPASLNFLFSWWVRIIEQICW